MTPDVNDYFVMINVEMRQDDVYAGTFSYFSTSVPLYNDMVDLFKVTGGKTKRVMGKVTYISMLDDPFEKYVGWIDLYDKDVLRTVPTYVRIPQYNMVLALHNVKNDDDQS